MAVYGYDWYAGARYGAPLVLEFTAQNFTAISEDYGQVFLSWANPTGSWSQFRLVRNSYGIPVDQDDGFVIIDTDSPPTSFTDSGLPEGEFQYYRAFVLADADGLWHPAAEAVVLVLRDFGHTDELYELIPEAYRIRDQKVRVSDEHPLLYNFLSIFGLGFDHLHGEYRSLTWLNDPDQVSGGLLPVMAQQFGVEWEPELGMRQMRQYLRNVIHLYKLKGTRIGIEGAASALTGWPADASWDGTASEVVIELQADRVNLIVNPSFETGIHDWAANNATVAQTPDGAQSGTQALRVTASSSGDAGVQTA